MELLTLVALVGLVLVLLAVLRSKASKQLRLPPGPKGDLLTGQSFQNWNNVPYMTKVGKKFGDIFNLRVFGMNVVVLNTCETIKEAYGSDWITGRPKSQVLQQVSNGGHGIVFAEGLVWRVHRRFALSVLRDFGFGKSKSEATIQTELQYLYKLIEATKGQAFSPKCAFVKAVSNVITSMVFDERCSEDPEFEVMIEKMQTFVSQNSQSLFFAALWPIMKYFPGDATGLKRQIACRNAMYTYVSKRFAEHKKTFDESNIRDYIDAFLAELQNPQKDATFTQIQLCQSILELFIAGSETTATTMLWAIVFLVKHPEVQTLMQQEIDSTIGDSKVPQVSDRAILPYCDAVIHEIQRCATLVPLGVPHRATEDGKLCGYDIPKDTVVIADLWNAHRTGSWWKDPDHFNPHNFLDDNGKLTNSQYLLSFSTGKRVCLGESLAKQELFVFIVGLVQRFEFKEDPNSPITEDEDTVRESVVRSPIPYNVIARVRC